MSEDISRVAIVLPVGTISTTSFTTPIATSEAPRQPVHEAGRGGRDSLARVDMKPEAVHSRSGGSAANGRWTPRAGLLLRSIRYCPRA